MGLYDRHILPHCIDLAMRSRVVRVERQRLLPGAEGRVLEIGIGSGLNLPHYAATVTSLVGLEPSEKLLRMTRDRARQAAFEVSLIEASAEEIPLDDTSFDSVVMTWTLCTIPRPPAALAELRRVLKPGGALLFVEHGRAPEAAIARWQDRLNPLQRRLGGGCNLNRRIDERHTRALRGQLLALCRTRISGSLRGA
jgi:ubiquinone/menaquinone biosynthesis C-methylase UbiE